MGEYVAAVNAVTGRAVTYQDLPEEEYAAALVGAGLPGPVAATLADADRAMRAGWLATDTGDLSRLIGRPTTSLDDALRAALA
jgi:NAD(P)H dehydrogenase (quinone)